MPIYAYKGLSPQGREVVGVIDADSPKSARLSLRRTGIFPTALNEEQTTRAVDSTGATNSLARMFERVSAQELALLTRQFATLARAGLPLVECLGTLIDQMERAPLKR